MLKRSMISAVLLSLSSGVALAQSTPTVADLLSSAKALADNDWRGVYLSVCIPEGGTPVIPTVNPANYPTTTQPTPPGGTPPRANWYAPPAKIGDNLYFLGTREHNSYALVSKDGEIILIDALFAYATPDEMLTGLQELGLDPYKVRYLLIAHAHGDHDGGAHLIEEAIPGVTIVYGEGDWPSVLNRTGPHATRFGPRNDGTDGRVITVGDVSVRIVTMPGHTPGTLSFLFEFKDKGKPIRVAYPGGTSFSFNATAEVYDRYIASTRKFAQAAADFGATALISNHATFDGGYYKAQAALALRAVHGDHHRHANEFFDRGRGDKDDSFVKDVPNPFLLGQRRVLSYMGVIELCAMAGKLRATGGL